MRRVIVWRTLLYTLALLSLALLWRLGVDSWWVALPNIVLPFLFTPLLLFISLAVWVRSRRYLFSTFVLTLLFVVSYGGLFLPRPPVSTDPTGTPLRVMTFNHLYLNRDLEDIKAAILRGDADTVALQELTPEVAEGLRRDLRGRYPHMDLRPSLEATRTDGVGLLSRLPFTDARYGEAYRGQRLTVRLAGQDVTVINLHLMIPFGGRESSRPLAYDPRRRGLQLGALEQTVADLAGPLVVVVVDFNLSDREPGYRRLERLMTDVYRRTRTGFGFTFPSGRSSGCRCRTSSGSTTSGCGGSSPSPPPATAAPILTTASSSPT